MYSDAEESLGVGLVVFVVAAIIYIITVTAITDTHGVQPWMHREPVPPAIVQLAPDSYIAPNTTLPESVCKSGVYRVRPVQALDNRSFIQCTGSEVWGAKGPGSPNFWNAFIRNAQTLWFWIILGVMVFICFIHGTVLAIGEYLDGREADRLKRERLPKARQELLDEYARRDWSDDPTLEQEYLDKIARLSV